MLEDRNTISVSRGQLVPAVCQTRTDVIKYIEDQQGKAYTGSGTRSCYDLWLPILRDETTYSPQSIELSIAVDYERLHRLLSSRDVQADPMLQVYLTDYETTLYFIEMKCVHAKVVTDAYK